MSREAPPPYSGTAQLWAEDLTDYLTRSRSQLAFKDANDRATEDGIILWDTTGYPVVSKDGEFRQIVLADGHGDFIVSSNLTFTTNTETTIPFTAAGTLHGLSLNGNDIVFEEAGHYLSAFSAQLYSTSSSTVNFVFWSRIIAAAGGSTDAYTMRNALHQNGSALVVSRTGVFEVQAGDKLRALAAVDSSSASLQAFAANQIATEPAAPAATLSVLRVHQ
jgi:hypothetical protein